MNRSNQIQYTVALLLICLVAAPFIVSGIWGASEDVPRQPTADVTPPAVSTSAPPASAETDTPPAAVPTETVPVPTDASVSPSDTIVPPSSETVTETVPATELIPVTTDAGSFTAGDVSYFDDALIIGDSRTVGIKEYGTLSNADFFCNVGMMACRIDEVTVDGKNFDQAISAKQYGKVYLMLGANEVGYDHQYLFAKYKEVVERIRAHQPNAILVLEANLHVSASAETDTLNNESLNEVNRMIAGLADNQTIFYLDINQVYDDSTGCLADAYTSDGVHPLAKYYRQWCDWLCANTPTGSTAAS